MRKQPIIRPGQRVPYQKGKPTEIIQRRRYIARLLDRGVKKMEIHRRVKKRFNRQWRTTDRDIEFVCLLKKLKTLLAKERRSALFKTLVSRSNIGRAHESCPESSVTNAKQMSKAENKG